MTAERDRVPDVTLERYRLGELDRDTAARIERLLGTDDGLARRLAALEQSDDEIRRAYAPEDLARDVIARLASDRPAARRSNVGVAMKWGIPAALAAAAVLLVLRPDERVKGSAASLIVYRSTASGSQALSDNDVAHAGDLIRLGYRTAEPAYGAIVSVDGTGVTTTHLPSGPDTRRAVALEPGGTVLLPVSFELDDAPRFERFYFVTSSVPFDIGPVLDAARRAAGAGDNPSPPKLPAHMTLTTFSLRKE